jgi:molybdopterin-guanine dinucleotide biosynthesis protein A
VATDRTVAGVVLAGGKSRRMGGQPKSLLEVGGKTLLELVKTRARPQVGALMLNVNGDRTPYLRFGLPMMADSIEDFAGPLAGILTALEWARDGQPGVEWVVSFPVDMPLIPMDLASGLRNTIRNTDADMACAASGGQVHPVVGIWPVRVAQELRDALQNDGVRQVDEFTGRYRLAFAEWAGGSADPFLNVNTKSDVKTLEERLGLPTGKASAR